MAQINSSLQRWEPIFLSLPPSALILFFGLYAIKNHAELAVVLCFVFLDLAVAGGGRLSVDAVRRCE